MKFVSDLLQPVSNQNINTANASSSQTLTVRAQLSEIILLGHYFHKQLLHSL